MHACVWESPSNSKVSKRDEDILKSFFFPPFSCCHVIKWLQFRSLIIHIRFIHIFNEKHIAMPWKGGNGISRGKSAFSCYGWSLMLAYPKNLDGLWLCEEPRETCKSLGWNGCDRQVDKRVFSLVLQIRKKLRSHECGLYDYRFQFRTLNRSGTFRFNWVTLDFG